MKKITFIILLFLCNQIGIAQTDLRDGRHYFKYSMTTELTECNIDGSNVSTSKRTPAIKQFMKKNWIFTIDAIVGTDYIIHVAKFTANNVAADAQNKLTWQDSNSENIYFKLTKSQYDSNAERLKSKGSFVVGASTTLIKIRPGNNEEGANKIPSEFGNDFNLGLNAGWRLTPWDHREVALSFVGGVSFSSIRVTPQTTRNFITSEATQGCITGSAGLILEIEKFQISGFVGIDAMSGEIGENWIYRNRPWFGIGFGYEIFKPQKSAENKD